MAKVIHFQNMEGAAWNGAVVKETSPGDFVERYVTPEELNSQNSKVKLQSPNGTVFLLTVDDDGQVSTIKEGDSSGS
ncbi:hypothetical protein BSQ39_13000 [Loigolactobacillus backii]|uniref:hypothetical protein n=1 Tax=Loigolactobacillus backii TaxID=375175 RepID=UPI000C1CA0FC|nr:hypothetical protein [Loigolactobacillus backii]PIO80002.1 hypothetical protein BSQ39_13000 [Loigolactobacillus backii]